MVPWISYIEAAKKGNAYQKRADRVIGDLKIVIKFCEASHPLEMSRHYAPWRLLQKRKM